ncbi:ABC transporter permease [uncultured Fusobacterium sp.]|uniref:ABC transporter permease n=1 Tax=uncultured Fusobacterium sp. TaxID=159267 RepID=UPI0025FA37EA|nr:ABC transporter permease [uncultured Fusobacterium sp.]
MKKLLWFLKFRYIYIYFLLYMVADYFFKGRVSELGIFSFIDSYFGIVVFPLIIILLFSILFPFITNKTKKMLLSVRLYCFFLLSISCILLYLMYILKLPFAETIADDEIIKEFFQLSIYKYKIGLVATYGFYLLLTNVMFKYLYIGLGVIIFCTTFLIVAKAINRGISKMYHNYKEKKRIAREEQLIREQIAIKEALEKREALMKEKLEQEKENKIKERVEEVLLNKELILDNSTTEVENILEEEKKTVTKSLDPNKNLSQEKIENRNNPPKNSERFNDNFNLFTINDNSKEKDKNGNILDENIKNDGIDKINERELLKIIKEKEGVKNDTSIKISKEKRDS